MKQFMKALIVMLLIMLLLQVTNSQHYQAFTSNIIILQPLQYSQQPITKTNQQFRNFTISSSLAMITNTSLIFSPLSFSYFNTQISCRKVSQQPTTITISCSMNVYKLAYLLVEKGPNMFVMESYKDYQIDKKTNGLYDTVDVSEWMAMVSFPIQSLGTKYEIKLHNFITTIGVYSNNTIQQKQTITLNSINLQPIYHNITLTNLQIVSVPLSVNVTMSRYINKVGFFSIVVIKQMISLSYMFQELSIQSDNDSDNSSSSNNSLQQGQLSLGYFSGISQLTFYLYNNLTTTTNTSLNNNNNNNFNTISFNTEQNITLLATTYNVTTTSQLNKTQTQLFTMKKFYKDKLYNFTKGNNLQIKLNVLKDYYYSRCSDKGYTHYKRMTVLEQGKLYKLVSYINTSLQLSNNIRDNTLILSSNNNTTTNSSESINNNNNSIFIHSLGSNRYRLLNLNTHTPLIYNKASQSYLLQYNWSIDPDENKWRVIYNVGDDNVGYIIISLQGINLYIGVQNSNVVQGSRVMLRFLSSGLYDSFKWRIVQMGDYNEYISNNLNNTNSNTSSTLSPIPTLPSPLVLSPYDSVQYYPQLNPFISSSYNTIVKDYYYFSIKEQTCYTQSIVDSISMNNLSQQQSYFVNALYTSTISSMNNNTISTIISNASTLLSVIDLSPLWYLGSHIYGVVLNSSYVYKYVSNINKGYARYIVDDNAYQLIVYYDNTSVNNKNNLIPIPIGCESIHPRLNNTDYQCQKCLNTYVMYQPTISPSLQNTTTTQQYIQTKQCYCPLNQYMTSNKQCRSCSQHQYRCQPPINIQVEILTDTINTNNNQDINTTQSQKQQLQQSKQLMIRVYIYKSQQTIYKFMTPINQLLNKTIVVINSIKYNLPQINEINDCIQQDTQYSLCINFIIKNISKQSYYNVQVTTDIKENNNQLLDGYLLVGQSINNVTDKSIVSSLWSTLTQPFKRLLYQTFPQISSTSTSSPTSIYFTPFHTPQTTITQPHTIHSIITQSLPSSIPSLNNTSSIILMAAPFILDKFNLLSILQTNSILYMISFFKFNVIMSNKKKNKMTILPSVVRNMFIFRQQPTIKVFSLSVNQNNTNNNSNNQQYKGWLQLPSYNTPFQQQFLYNSTAYSSQLSYPQSLYQSTIPSMNIITTNNNNNNSNGGQYQYEHYQNYMTLTLNSLVLVLVQILVMQLIMKLIGVICGRVKEVSKDNEGKQITTVKVIQYNLSRHVLIGGIDDDNNNNNNNNYDNNNNNYDNNNNNNNADNNNNNYADNNKQLQQQEQQQQDQGHNQNLTTSIKSHKKSIRNIKNNNNNKKDKSNEQSQQLLQLLTQKRIQWTPMPELKHCQNILTLIKHQSNNIKTIIQQQSNKIKQQQSNKPQQQQLQQWQIQQQLQKQKQKQKQQQAKNNQSTITQKILFFTSQLKQKRLIFYSSFILIHVISQSYLLYFQLIKPFDPSQSNSNTNNAFSLTLLKYFDMVFGFMMMFMIIVFPVVLINYFPLHLLKIVQVTCKNGAYTHKNHHHNQQNQQHQQQQNNQNNQNTNNNTNNLQSTTTAPPPQQQLYTQGEIYFHFCIIYYQLILIPFSVAIGNNIFQQSLPILLYQLFKLYWLYNKLKVLDKLKIITIAIVFSIIAVWHFIPYSQYTQELFQNVVILALYGVLIIQAAKLLKFVIVFVVGLIKTKQQTNIVKGNKNNNNKNQSNNKNNKSNKNLTSKKSINSEYPTTKKLLKAKFTKQVSIVPMQQQNSPSHSQYNTQKIILDKRKKHYQKPKTIKFKQIQPEKEQKENKKDKQNNNDNDKENQKQRQKGQYMEQKTQNGLDNNDKNNQVEESKYNKRGRRNKQYRTNIIKTKQIQLPTDQNNIITIDELQQQQPKHQSFSGKFNFTRKRQKTLK